MNKLLFATIILSILLQGCSKNNDTETQPPTSWYSYTPFLNALSDTVGLELTSRFTSVPMTNGDTLVLVGGLKHNKLWLGLFETVIPEKKYISRFVWNGGNVIEKTITEDLGYGESRVYSYHFVVATGVVYENGRKKFLANIDYSNYSFNNYLKYFKSFLVSLDNSNESCEAFPLLDEEFSFPIIIGLWYGDTYIIKRKIGRADEFYCHDKSDTQLFKFAISPIDYHAVNQEDGIKCSPTDIVRINLRTGVPVWSHSLSFPNVPNDARYDAANLKAENGNIWTYMINITLYSGEKITREFTINIDTGEVNYI